MTRQPSWLWLWCAWGALVCCIYGCDSADSGTGSGSAASRPAGRPVIAVIPKGTTHEFWKSVHAGAEKAGQELDLEIIWKGPLKEDDRASQIETVESFITRGVSGIVLAPLDETALVAPVASATRAGIPVVVIDSGLKGGDYASFVATDNYRGGQMAGERLAETLGGKGRVVLLRYAVGSASTDQREAGFLDAIKKHAGITVVSQNQYGGATRESAIRASENLLNMLLGSGTSSGLTVDGIFCPNESTTFGMLKVLTDIGAAGTVKFVGFDAAPDLVAALKEGKIDALVVQNPFNMGYLGVKTMVQKLRGEAVPRRIDTGATLVTQQNLNDPKVSELLNPDLKKWLKE
jgi:ribose transport system substrate-binding protein